MTERTPPPITVQHHPGVSVVRVRGVIDEHFDAIALSSQLAGRSAPVVVDLDGVSRITSFGVRQWLDGLRGLATETIYFVRCRPAMVAQFNSVPQFGGRGNIVSFYCPYLCPDCDTAFETLLDVRTGREALTTQTAPAAKCPKCNADAEFDDLEQSYFRRPAAAIPSSIPPAVEAAIDGGLDKPKSAFRVAKHVDADLTAVWLAGTIDKSARLRRYADGLEGRVIFVLGEVTAVTPEGTARLKEALDVAAGALLARVPIFFSTWLLAQERRPSIISFEFRGDCPQCKIVRAVDVTGKAEKPPCPVCGAALEGSWPDDAGALAAEVKITPTPPDARRYLEEHVEFPDTAAADSGTSLTATPTRTPSTPLLFGPGMRLGKYEIVRRIGMGGMAEILLGKQLGPEGFEKRVVIKRILPHLAVQPSFVKMFTQEARVAARLEHAHIVQIYDLCREQDEFFIVMEYVRGPDLNTIVKLAIRMDQQLPIEFCVRAAAAVSGALHAAHSYVDDTGKAVPVLHRDVTSHNILVSRDGQVKLTDFGVSKAADSLQNTGTGMLKGKVMYMAPEHVRAGVSDPRIDVFAVGLVLYLCLTLRHPFRAPTEMETLKAVLEKVIEPVQTLRADIPDDLAAIVMRAVERDAEKRYSSALALQSDLDTWLAKSGKPASSAQTAAWLASFLDHAQELGIVGASGTGTPTHKEVDTTKTTPEKMGRLRAAGMEDDTVALAGWEDIDA